MFLEEIRGCMVQVQMHPHEAWSLAVACEYIAAMAQGSQPHDDIEDRIRKARMTPDAWSELVEGYAAMFKAAALASALSGVTTRVDLQALDSGRWFQTVEEVEAIRLRGAERFADLA